MSEVEPACCVHADGREKEKRPCGSVYVVRFAPAVVVPVVAEPAAVVPVVAELAARVAVAVGGAVVGVAVGGAVVGVAVGGGTVGEAVGAVVGVAVGGAVVGVGGRGVSVGVSEPPHATSATANMRIATQVSPYRRFISFTSGSLSPRCISFPYYYQNDGSALRYTVCQDAPVSLAETHHRYEKFHTGGIMGTHHPSAYVASRPIGDATVTAICDGTARWQPSFAVPAARWRAAIPEADADGRFTIGFHVFHIQTPDASILVDAGFDDPDSTWGRKFARTWEGVSRSPGVEAGLAAIGVRPETITQLVITHAHFDHYVGTTIERADGFAPRFPNARHLLGAADRVNSRYGTPPDPELDARMETLARLGLLDLVEGDRTIAPGVTMLHAPGESPGHSLVRVESAGARFYALGDLLHHPCEAHERDWVLTNRDAAAMRQSRDRLIAEAVPRHALLAFSHAPFPPWGAIVPTDGDVRWEWAEDGRR
jgi:glyoxylase-like metal-dependent hydrolase (beta-lactamase superfamily II)